jgi:hypothetical protein
VSRSWAQRDDLREGAGRERGALEYGTAGAIRHACTRCAFGCASSHAGASDRGRASRPASRNSSAHCSTNHAARRAGHARCRPDRRASECARARNGAARGGTASDASAGRPASAPQTTSPELLRSSRKSRTHRRTTCTARGFCVAARPSTSASHRRECRPSSRCRWRWIRLTQFGDDLVYAALNVGERGCCFRRRRGRLLARTRRRWRPSHEPLRDVRKQITENIRIGSLFSERGKCHTDVGHRGPFRDGHSVCKNNLRRKARWPLPTSLNQRPHTPLRGTRFVAALRYGIAEQFSRPRRTRTAPHVLQIL